MPIPNFKTLQVPALKEVSDDFFDEDEV